MIDSIKGCCVIKMDGTVTFLASIERNNIMLKHIKQCSFCREEGTGIV